MSILQLGSDTLAGTAAAGQIEYNGTIQTFTPLGTQRGVVPSEQFFALNAGLAGANATGAQNILGVGVTLSASTQYEFEMAFTLSKTAGTTSHTISLGFGGTATLNNIFYEMVYIITPPNGTLPNGAASAIGSGNSASPFAWTPAITTANAYEPIIMKGTVSINAGGTFIPQYTLSAAPGGAYTTQAGSYMKIKPIGVAGSNVSVGAWA